MILFMHVHPLIDRIRKDLCQIQLAYAIGVAEPVSVLVDTFDTGKYSDEEILSVVKNKDFSHKEISLLYQEIVINEE